MLTNSHRAPSGRIALVTCAELAGLDPDDQALVPALAPFGLTAQAAVWDDPAVDWAGYDLVVLRSTWDYPARRDEFLAWAERVPRLANPAGVVTWNTDKRYLAELTAVGVPVVPTTWLAPGTAWTPPAGGEWVIKPAIGAGGKNAGRYDLADPEHRTLALAHMVRLHASGRLVILQPYLSAVDSSGETALLFLDGEFSHAIRKGPLLDGPDRGVDGLYRPEEITAREPTPAQLAVATSALGAVPGSANLLYARVDLIPGPDGAPLLVELELTEPSLFLAYADGAASRLASAIARAVPARQDQGSC